MSEKLNIQDLVDLFAEKQEISKKSAECFVKEFFSLIEEALEKDKYIKIKGLGTFKLIEVESRESINVNTGERFKIQGHKKISFTPDSTLKEVINKPFAHFETIILNEETLLEDTNTGRESAIEDSKGSTEILNEEPIEKNEIKVDTKLPQKTSKLLKIYLGIIIIAICASAIFTYIYFPDIFNFRFTKIEEKKEFLIPDSEKEEIIDTIIEKVETTEENSTSVKEKHSVSKNVQKAFTPDSTGYKIIGTKSTHAVKEGETLTRIALQYYGTKALWPYLVKHNPNTIKNPNNVPYGTIIKIPDLIEK